MSVAYFTKTIALRCFYANLGDDALFIATYKIVKNVFPKAKVALICDNEQYVKKLLPNENIVVTENEYKINIDMLIYGGGTQFFSFPLSKRASLLTRLFRHIRKPATLVKISFNKISSFFYKIKKKALTNKPKICALGIGVGPFYEDIRAVSIVRKLFLNIDFISVRDLTSYELCKSWGCKNLSLSADLCYLANLWNDYLPPNTKLNNKKNKIERIGVIVRDWLHTKEGKSYNESLFQVVDELRNNGKYIEFISFSSYFDKIWERDLKERGEQYAVWDPFKYKLSEFLEFLSSFDAFITSRYHGAVFASILRKPFICIEVEQKLRFISDIFGGSAYLWAYPFNPSECFNLISELDANYLFAVDNLDRVVHEQEIMIGKMMSDLQIYFS